MNLFKSPTCGNKHDPGLNAAEQPWFLSKCIHEGIIYYTSNTSNIHKHMPYILCVPTLLTIAKVNSNTYKEAFLK